MCVCVSACVCVCVCGVGVLSLTHTHIHTLLALGFAIIIALLTPGMAESESSWAPRLPSTSPPPRCAQPLRGVRLLHRSSSLTRLSLKAAH